MTAQPACPEHSRLQGLLDSNLPAGERRALILHLDSCVYCQASLGQTLRQAPADFPSALSDRERNVSTVIAPAPKQAGSLKAPPPLPPANPLPFLTPTDQPGFLGRLGHFEITRLLARGGMGLVLEAFDPHLQRTVALKVLDPALANDAAAGQRFCREARAAASITHEHVVAVHHVEQAETSGLPFLVMQLVTGSSLEDWLEQHGRPGLVEIVRIGMQTAAGLAAAHARGLIHRDVKPSNILLEACTGAVKLTDFGLARAVEDVKLTRTGFIAGTPMYMSPEQARDEETDHRSDLFSLGLVLYELCTGLPPFTSDTALGLLRRLTDEPHQPISEINPEIPSWLSALVDRLLAKSPADRIDSAAEVARILAHHLAQLQPMPLPVSVLPPPLPSQSPGPEKPRSRRVWPWFVGYTLAVLAINLVGVLVYIGWQSSSGQQARDYEPLRTLDGNAGPVWSVAFDPGTGMVAMGIDDGTVKFWDSAGQVQATINAHNGPVWALGFRRDGGLYATGSDDNLVKLWKHGESQPCKTLEHPGPVRSLAFSPNGRQLVVGCRDGSLLLWDVETFVARRLRGHDHAIAAVAFSYDGRTVASAAADKTVKLWNAITGEERVALKGHTGRVYAVTFDPTGQLVASGSWDRTVRLWDVKTGLPKAVLQGHEQDVWAVAFSPDGQVLVSGNEDHTAKLWNVADEQEIATLKGHTGSVYAVAFSPDGTTLATGGRDGTVKLWSMADLRPH